MGVVIFICFIKEGIMKKKVLLVFSLFIFVVGAVSSFAEQNSGCVRCHTDDAVMKSLFMPPKTAAGGGEG